MFKPLITIAFILVFISCKSSQLESTYNELDFGAFSIQVPSNWEKVTRRGIDSYIGGIKLDANDTLYFDLGMYSNTLSNQSNSTMTFEKINGFDAKIVSPKSGTKGITGVYIDSLSGEGMNRNRFNLYGRNISKANKRAFLRSIRTLKFKR